MLNILENNLKELKQMINNKGLENNFILDIKYNNYYNNTNNKTYKKDNNNNLYNDIIYKNNYNFKITINLKDMDLKIINIIFNELNSNNNKFKYVLNINSNLLFIYFNKYVYNNNKNNSTNNYIINFIECLYKIYTFYKYNIFSIDSIINSLYYDYNYLNDYNLLLLCNFKFEYIYINYKELENNFKLK